MFITNFTGYAQTRHMHRPILLEHFFTGFTKLYSVYIEMTIFAREIKILWVHGHTENSSITDKDNFLDSLGQEMVNIRNSQELIMTGELNSRQYERKQITT